ncbi:MAG: type II toxin-antitoxin system VapC family toxin [Candidatus Daviesbacteria bacterium]|nr:type II toxin-antitoxin system VapC family toxin [Candidatus Daviesbacteria bacterium]
MNNPVVVVDADAIIAQAYPDDSNHKLAVTISENLNKFGAQVIYPATAILEATTVLQGKLNSGATAYGTAVVFTDPNIQVAEVNQETLRNAIKYFSPTTSKKNTLFDCIVATVAEEYKADAIFSFDHFYKTKGFKLANELKKN